jgi:hypothetical protein
MSATTTLIERIEIVLAADDLHSAEIIGLIAAATTVEGKLQHLILQLHTLRDAVAAEEQAAQLQKPGLYWSNEPDRKAG